MSLFSDVLHSLLPQQRRGRTLMTDLNLLDLDLLLGCTQ